MFMHDDGSALLPVGSSPTTTLDCDKRHRLCVHDVPTVSRARPPVQPASNAACHWSIQLRVTYHYASLTAASSRWPGLARSAAMLRSARKYSTSSDVSYAY